MIKEYQEIIYTTRRRLFSSGYGGEITPLYGDGGEFAEIAEYSGGDIRHLNYKATAKSGTPKVNLYHDSRNLNLILLYVASASMVNKHPLAIEILTSLSYSASLKGDRVSTLIYSDGESEYISGYRGDTLAKIIYHKLKDMELLGRVATLDMAFSEVAEVARRRSLIFIVSDLFEIGEIEKLSYRNEVVLIRIREREEEYPNLLNGSILKSPLDGDILKCDIDTQTLNRYRGELNRVDSFWERRAKESNIILAPLYSDSDPYPILREALSR